MDPKDLLQADLEARQAGLEVLGIWHSHPEHPALPSLRDEKFAWSGWSYVILSLGPKEPEIRSWRWTGKEFLEEELS
jgi:proteasome lid subunit RPN8/RPN11